MVPHLDAVVSRITENAVIDVCLGDYEFNFADDVEPVQKENAGPVQVECILARGRSNGPSIVGFGEDVNPVEASDVDALHALTEDVDAMRTGGGAEGQ